MNLYRTVVVVFGILLPLGLIGCGAGGGSTRPARNVNTRVGTDLVDATNDFGFRLYRQLALHDGGINLFVSPPSIELALAMTYNGARNSTQTGMATTLGVDAMSLDAVNQANGRLLSVLANPDPKVDLRIANALWIQQGMRGETGFLQRNQDYYGATVQAVPLYDPATADAINRWADEHTLGTIKNIVTTADIKDDIIELTNAVYFKGPWTDPFDPKLTQNRNFTTFDGSTKTIPMMLKGDVLDYQENDLFQAVRLPYGGKYVSMYVFLPKPGKTVADFAAQLTNQNWTQWLTGFQSQVLDLYLPRFKAKYGVNLQDPLTAMGMAEAFDPFRADFGGIFAPETVLPGNVFLTHVFHKTFLSVDEKGTTAAAVTDVGGGGGSMPPSMVVNRPFFVVIADGPTGVILFLGSITDPE